MTSQTQMAPPATHKDANVYSETSRSHTRRQSPRTSLADVSLPSQKSSKKAKAFLSSDVRQTRIETAENTSAARIPIQGDQDIGQELKLGGRLKGLLSSSDNGRKDESHENLKDRHESGETAKAPDSSQDSEPVRHAKRRRNNEIFKQYLSNCDSSPVRSPTKRTRTLRRGRTLSNSLSREESLSLRDELETENCCKDNIGIAPSLFSRVVVEVPVFDDFDRDAYAKVSASSSQTTGVANIQGSQESLSQHDAPAPVFVKKSVIPDSQDSLGSWNYESSSRRISVTAPRNSPKITNPQNPSLAVSEIPDLEVVSSPSQTSSIAPSAQPDYIDYYLVDSQLSSGSSKPAVQADSIRNEVESGRHTPSRTEESQDLSVNSEIPLVLDSSILSDNALEDLLRESPGNLHNQSGVWISPAGQETVNIEEEGALKVFRRSRTPPKVNSNKNSSESWQGAQIVPNFDFSVSQRSLRSLEFDTNCDNSTSSTEQQGPSLTERSRSSSNHSGLLKRGTNPLKSVPLQKSVPDEHLQKLTKRDGCASALSPQAKNRKFDTAQRGTAREGSHFLLRKSSSQTLHTGPQNNTPVPQPRKMSTSDMADHETESSSAQVDYAALVMAARDKARTKYDQSPGLRDLEKHQGGPLIADTPSQMLPVREGSNLVPTSINPTDEVSDEDESQSSLSNGVHHIPGSKLMERIVFLPLPSMVRDIYFTELKRHKNQIRPFLSEDTTDQNTLDQMNAMIDKLKMITDHQDIPYEESPSQQSLTDEQVVKWATTCSPKCLFLQHLLRRLRIHAGDIAIVARPGRMLDILELILKEDRQTYNRLDRPGQSNTRNIGGLTIDLIPSGMNGGQNLINRADAVIAFDDTSRMSARFSNVAERSDRGLPSPVISLVVAFSPDHIELCLPDDMDPIERTLSLVDFIIRTREGLGQLSTEFPSPEEAAAIIAGYVPRSVDDDAAWPLQLNIAIPGLGFPIYHQLEKPTNLVTQPQSLPVSEHSTPHGAVKRTLRAESIGEANADGSKRMRMTPAPGDLASSGDVTRISESVDGTRQKTSSTEAANDAIAKVKELDEEQSKQITSLLDKVDDLEKQLQSKQSRVKDLETTAERLSQRVKELEARIEDLTNTIQHVQPKYRKAIADKGKAEVERDAAQSEATKLNIFNNTRLEEIAKLKIEKTNLEVELTNARATLSTSSVPEAARLAQAQDQVRELLAEKDRLEKRVASLQGNFDFTRDAYQKASSYVTELNIEITQLKEENMILKRQASDNRVRIAEIQRASEARQREERVEELEALLRDRERELAKKSEELKIKTNGRRETRGTSVPRSPRLGSGAMSPRPQFARTAGGSRGASPAPGETREGFRDPPLFPPSGLGSARYSHLT